MASRSVVGPSATESPLPKVGRIARVCDCASRRQKPGALLGHARRNSARGQLPPTRRSPRSTSQTSGVYWNQMRNGTGPVQLLRLDDIVATSEDSGRPADGCAGPDARFPRGAASVPNRCGHDARRRRLARLGHRHRSAVRRSAGLPDLAGAQYRQQLGRHAQADGPADRRLRARSFTTARRRPWSWRRLRPSGFRPSRSG